MSLITYPVTFDAVNLESINGLTVLRTNAYIPPRRKLTVFDIARVDKAKTTSAFYRDKSILVRISITRRTRALLEQSIDALMKILQGREKELILQQSGSSRKYICTLGDTVVEEDGGAYIEMDLLFTCSDQFGYDVNLSTLLSTGGFTTTPRHFALTFGGSAEAQNPIILATLTLVTGGTTASITIGNPETSRSITIFRNWSAGDSLEIDTLNKTVRVNGGDVSYSGSFPTWKPGIRYISYADTFTTRSIGILVTYRAAYI